MSNYKQNSFQRKSTTRYTSGITLISLAVIQPGTVLHTEYPINTTNIWTNLAVLIGHCNILI